MDRAKGLLHVALSCIYLQEGDATCFTLGRKYLSYDAYKSVLTRDDVYGCIVSAYMTQGYAHGPSSTDLVQDHEASFVNTQWIFAHMHLPQSIRCYPDFETAVELTERAAETMLRVSFKIGQTALELAELMGVKEEVIEADRIAESALIEDQSENDIKPELPSKFYRMILTPPESKTDRRLAFETEVLEVFSFGVRPARREWVDIDEITLCTTCMRKDYADMTPQERVSSGSVILKSIKADLINRPEAAILESMVASRALAILGRRFLKACSSLCGDI